MNREARHDCPVCSGYAYHGRAQQPVLLGRTLHHPGCLFVHRREMPPRYLVGQLVGQSGTVENAGQSISGQTNAGTGISDFSQSISSSLSNAMNVGDAAQSAYQTQTAAIQDYLAQQQAIARRSANQAAGQASTAASGLGTIIVASVAVLAIVLILRK